MAEISEQVVNWLLTVLCVVLTSVQPADSKSAVRVDVLGPAGFVQSLRLEEGEGGSVAIFREVSGAPPAPLGAITPVPDEEGVVRCSGGGTEVQLDLRALGREGEALRDLKDGGPPIAVTIAGERIVVARRGANVYLSDAGRGETYVLRLPR